MITSTSPIPNALIEIAFQPNPDKGEDAYAYTLYQNYGVMGVFDGCGGLGGQTYPNYAGYTGAKIASHVLANELYTWTSELSQPPKSDVDAQLQDRFLARLADYKRQGQTSLSLTGSMVRPFPSTASIALVDYSRAESFGCRFLWAGDSRGYILGPMGLKQYTKDDLSDYTDDKGNSVEMDAFENLYEDAPLTNLVCAQAGFTLRQRAIRRAYPAIVITCTDGVFGYLPSPMHFEALLLSTMQKAPDFDGWKKLLRARIAEVASDDATLLLAPIGFKNFAGMKQQFAARAKAMQKYAAADGAGQSRQQLRAQWREYKLAYDATGGRE